MLETAALQLVRPAALACVQVACVSQPHVRLQHRSQTPTLQDIYLCHREAQARRQDFCSCTADWAVPAMPQKQTICSTCKQDTAPRSRKPFSMNIQGGMKHAQSPPPSMCSMNLPCQPAVSMPTCRNKDVVANHVYSTMVIINRGVH